MKDIKNIITNKQSRLRSLLALRKKSTLNSYKQIAPEPPKRKQRLKIILPVLVALFAVYTLIHLIGPAKNAVSSVNKSVPQKPAPLGKLDLEHSFQVAFDALPSAQFDGNRFLARRPDGATVVYAINPALQDRVKRLMAEYNLPYGVFVAVEPKTGRVLAFASHSSTDHAWEAKAPFNIYPMASLFKVVTAAAALEQRKVTPTTVIRYRGRVSSETPRVWEVNKKRQGREMDLTTAMGKSVNPVFGRLASDIVGKAGIIDGMTKFGFNQTLFPGVPMVPCSGTNPKDNAELMLLGAGLSHEVRVSPIYAAFMMAAIANKGVMLQPLLATEIRSERGELLYNEQVQQVRRIVTPETAAQLSKMMSTTVSHGTSRKVFRDRRGRPKLAALDIAAKTGSISGDDPPGHYSWFAAYAPINDPQIAIAALVVNNGKWKIKASYIGEQAFETFFK